MRTDPKAKLIFEVQDNVYEFVAAEADWNDVARCIQAGLREQIEKDLDELIIFRAVCIERAMNMPVRILGLDKRVIEKMQQQENLDAYLENVAKYVAGKLRLQFFPKCLIWQVLTPGPQRPAGVREK